MKDEMERPESGHEAADRNFVEVAVVTTSGSYPKKGFERTPIRQKIGVILKKAADKLEIKDTSDWVATVGEREVNADSTYLDNHLSGKVEIDYGPREGGGGNA